MLLLPKYLPIITQLKPTKKIAQILKEDALEKLKGRFECTEWSVLTDKCKNVDDLNGCVTDYMNFCVNSVAEIKRNWILS